MFGNGAIKKEQDRKALFQALLDDKLDVIATDHAPHTLHEKNNSYFKAPSGGPLVQHALPAMLEFVKNDKIKIEKVVEKMCHNPAICFQIEKLRSHVRIQGPGRFMEVREAYRKIVVLVGPLT